MSTEVPRRLGRPPTTVAGQTVPQRLVDAARDLFAEHGFEGASVADIVESAGVTKGAMYHYFGAKEDLLFEIYARILRMQTEQLEAVAALDEPPEVRLRTAATDVVISSAENLPAVVIFFRSLHQLREDQQLDVRAQRRRYHETFRSIILEGQGSGAFRGDIGADLAVDYFFGAVHHLPTWWNPEGRLGAREVAGAFADLLLRSLTP